MNTGRKQRPLGRDEKMYRDDKLFVIATEDRYAPKQYFDALRATVKSSRIKTKVLPTEDCRSSPAHVLERLKTFDAEHDSMPDDERWLLLDTDHWIQSNHKPSLMKVLNDARKIGYKVAMSRPCFEFWLLLHHHEDASSLNIVRCDDVRPHLLAKLSTYNKTLLKPNHYPLDSIASAILRAKQLDTEPADIPSKNGSRIYRIVEKIINSVPAHLR
jgi:hypothetical protein